MGLEAIIGVKTVNEIGRAYDVHPVQVGLEAQDPEPRGNAVRGVAGMTPGPATGKPHPAHKVYPYLLRGAASRGPIRAGAPTSPTSAWRMALPTWWR